MRNRQFYLIAAWALLAVCTLAGERPVLVGVHVRKDGAVPVEETYVLSHTDVRAGDVLDRKAVARDVKRLLKTGKFSFVGAEVDETGEGLVLVYVVRHKLRLDRVEIQGSHRMRTGKIRDLLGLNRGDLVDEAVLAMAARKVEAEYRTEYFSVAQVTPRLDVTDPVTGRATAHFHIDEGGRIRIWRATFQGNTIFSDRMLGKAVLRKKWWHFGRRLRGYRNDPDEIAAGLDIARAMYLKEGYLDVTVRVLGVTPLRKGKLRLDIGVDEGKRYRLGTVSVEGAEAVEVDTLLGIVGLATSDTASLAAVERAASNLREYYGNRGYIRSAVTHRLKPCLDRDDVVDLAFQVSEGHLVRVRNVRIRGNTQTRDKVIRRELLVFPGDDYNVGKIRTSARRLLNLGYFSQVNPVPEPAESPEETDLVFEVEEQKTGQLMLGVGFSSIDNFLMYMEVTQGNFDISGWPFRGGGQKLKVRAQLGDKRTDYEISFVEPWFLDRRLSLGADLFSRELRYLSSDYQQRQQGASVSVSKGLGRFSMVRVKYSLEEIEVFDVGDSASALIKEEEGLRTKSALAVTLRTDMRDSVFIPTRGSHMSVSAHVAGGPLNFDTDLYGVECRAGQYWPLWFGHVLNIRGWAAVVEEYGESDRVPIFDRLFLGGPRSLRGFGYRKAGPKDENGEALGGRSAATANAEYTIPLIEKIRLAFFYDIGNVWEEVYDFDLSSYYSDVGVGIRFDVPGFPIRFDWAWPLENDVYPGDDLSRAPEFQFSLGYAY